jgi:tetratricopeptide (TPR) repeat protein
VLMARRIVDEPFLWQEDMHIALANVEINIAYVEFTHWSLTEALLRAGDERHAVEEIERFAREVGTNQRLRIPYLRSLAALSAWRQEPKQAIKYLEEAVTLAQGISLPSEVEQMQTKLGELYLQVGQEG